MSQARRKQKKHPVKAKKSAPGSGFGMLLVGMLIGSALTALFLGYKEDPEHGFGSGINQMIEKSRQGQTGEVAVEQSAKPEQKASPNYDFYTILPEIEQVIPDEYIPPKPIKKSPTAAIKAKAKDEAGKDAHYILQAGSFGKRADADQQKAKLALFGYESYIQKVTVDGKRFFRVRMGPFRHLDKLNKAKKDMSSKGIEAIGIKVSKG